MRRRDAEVEPELILISEAVTRLKLGMYGGLLEPKPVASIKAKTKKGEVRPSIGWEPQNEDAAGRIYEVIAQGRLSVFVRPAGIAGKPPPMPLHVPLSVLTQMIRTRGGLPDYTVAAYQIFAKTPILPELLAALSASPLCLRLKEFEAWYEEVRKKRKWPSQRSHSKNNPIGRPSKQGDIQTSIALLVNAGRWSAEQNFIADLVRLLGSQGVKASRQSVQRAVIQLHRETGDHRDHSVDTRKQPDESVWGSSEDLADRRRRQHRK